MKIDENGNIEIESEKDYKNKRFNDYGFTSYPKQIIYTKDLVHCIGLALIKEVSGIRKRGLMHVFYNREFTRNGNGNIIVREDKLKDIEKILENFIRDFQKDDNNKKKFTDPRAIIVYNRTLLIDRTAEKIVLRDEFTGELNEREIEDKNKYENPMADYIRNWIKNKNIDLYLSQATTNKKILSVLNMEDDPKEIYHKEFALTNDKIRIGMYNKANILLNAKNYEAGLEF